MNDELHDLEPGKQIQPPSNGFELSDLIACLVGTAIGGVLTLILWKAAEHSKSDQTPYTTSIFLFVPGLAGFIAGVISNWNIEKSASTSWINATLIWLFSCCALLVCGFEGMICIVMAMPLFVPMIAFGVFLGRAIIGWRKDGPRILVSAAPVVAVVAVYTIRSEPGFQTRTESTSLIINAPPDKIWPYLFRIDHLPEPNQWIFKTGIAYTTGTDSGGQHVGDSRQCILTTGIMQERISQVEPNQYLRFDVLTTPPSMKEKNPFYDIHPPHERGSFKVHWGEFRLEPLSGGRTRLTGTSQYSYNIYPAAYWGLWTDTVAEQIHVRMMNEIKRRVEAANAQGH